MREFVRVMLEGCPDIAAPVKDIGPCTFDGEPRTIDLQPHFDLSHRLRDAKAKTRKRAMKRRQRRIAKKEAMLSTMQKALHQGGLIEIK